jgi:tRNA1Val (adenine37-N6)-methyltransferase
MSETEKQDLLFGGEITVYQPECGYRFSVDSLLLSSFITLRENSDAIELGSGCGVITIILAKRFPSVKFNGVEIQKDLCEFSEKNAEFNEINDRVEFINLDIRQISKHFSRNTFDYCLSNPPYREEGSGRISPDRGRAIARHEIELTLNELIESAGYLLKDKGHFYMIYNCGRIAEMISSLKEFDFYPKRIQIVYPFRGTEGNFVMVDSVYKGGEGCVVENPLVIWEEPGRYTEEVHKIINGEFL